MIGIRVKTDDKYAYVTMNYRHIVENNWLDDLQYICEPTEYHEKRVTVKWTCDRGISHEFVRHRVFSFAQESTRYCNYSKDKFGNELTFIRPSWLEDINSNSDFENYLCKSELAYFNLLSGTIPYDSGWKPQQARAILPNAIKTELVMTGFLSDWSHFFELRCAPSAHPDAQKLAKQLLIKLHEMYPGKFDDLYNKYIENGNND